MATWVELPVSLPRGDAVADSLHVTAGHRTATSHRSTPRSVHVEAINNRNTSGQSWEKPRFFREKNLSFSVFRFYVFFRFYCTKIIGHKITTREEHYIHHSPCLIVFLRATAVPAGTAESAY